MNRLATIARAGGRPVLQLLDNLFWSRRLWDYRRAMERTPEGPALAPGLPLGRSVGEGALHTWRALSRLRPLNGRLSVDSAWDDGYWSCLLSTLLTRHDATFLDVGSGCGQLAATVTNIFPKARYVGIDAISDAVDYCDREFANDRVRFHWLNVYNSVYNLTGSRENPSFPVESKGTDAVVSISLWTHLWPDIANHYFAESRRVLKDDGVFVGTFFILDDDYDATKHGYYPFEHAFEDNAGMFYQSRRSGVTFESDLRDPVAFTRATLEKMLDDNGMKLDRYLPGRLKLAYHDRGSNWQDVIIARPK